MEILLIAIVLVAGVAVIVGAKRGAELAQREREARWGGLGPLTSGGAGAPRPGSSTARPPREGDRPGARPPAGSNQNGDAAASTPRARSGQSSESKAGAADRGGASRSAAFPPAGSAPVAPARAAEASARRATGTVAQGAAATATAVRSSASAALRRRPATIDLNRAPVSELQKLPGVGVRAAERIVAHRERNGEFASVEDLEAVEGFDSHRVRRLAPHARV